MMNFELVRANINDAKKIALFLRQNFEIHNLKFETGYIKNSLNEGIWFLAKRNNEILGVIFLKIIKQDTRAEIKHLLVKKNFRRQGIGKALLNCAINLAIKRKIRKITGMMPSNNLKILKKVAKTFNFKLEGILKNHYRKNENVYVYSLFI